jgi:phosphatidylglycerophosphatase A
MNYFILLLASGFGAGFSPLVPGTTGTLAAIPLYLLLSSIPFPIYEWTIVAFFFLSCWISDKAQSYWGTKDDRRIVIDEIMGYFMTMMWLPRTVRYVVIGFFLFRFFDIFKPPPIRRLERVRGGYGVVLDDVVAGLYANIVLHIIHYVILSLAPPGRGMG